MKDKIGYFHPKHGWNGGGFIFKDYAPTIDAGIWKWHTLLVIENMDKDKKYRIRKLTPKECYRLMGFSDEDYEKAREVCSETQLYKQAGNSVVVNVWEDIIKQML